MGNDEKGKWLDATMNEMANSIVKDYEKINNKFVKYQMYQQYQDIF